jgi:hypothetical protein
VRKDEHLEEGREQKRDELELDEKYWVEFGNRRVGEVGLGRREGRHL